jgi:hypothetical protein
MTITFAATYPERTIALVLFGTGTTWEVGDLAEFAAYIEHMDRSWGTEEFARQELRDWAAPSLVDDERMVSWLASYLRRSASPGAAIALEMMNRGIDVSHVLPAIHVPTLVVSRTEDMAFTAEQGRAIAEGIPGARFIEHPGSRSFLLGRRGGPAARRGQPVREGDPRRRGRTRSRPRDRDVRRHRWLDSEGGRARRSRVAGALGRPQREGTRPARPVQRTRSGHRGRRVPGHVRRADSRSAMRDGRPRRGARSRDRASSRGCTPVKSSWTAKRSAGSPYTSARVSPDSPGLPRSSCPRR